MHNHVLNDYLYCTGGSTCICAPPRLRHCCRYRPRSRPPLLSPRLAAAPADYTQPSPAPQSVVCARLPRSPPPLPSSRSAAMLTGHAPGHRYLPCAQPPCLPAPHSVVRTRRPRTPLPLPSSHPFSVLVGHIYARAPLPAPCLAIVTASHTPTPAVLGPVPDHSCRASPTPTIPRFRI
jgi:hypothetical protein